MNPLLSCHPFRFRTMILLVIFSAGLSLTGCCRPLQMTLLHINDSHSHIEPIPLKVRIDDETIRLSSGGFARLSTRIRQVRDTEENVVFLHAGDAVQGTLYFTRYHGEPEIEWLNWMQCDAMVTGNHEYDKGGAILAGMIDRAEFPVLAANVDARNDPYLKDRLVPYTVIDVDGRDVAVIGLVSPETPMTSNPEETLIFMECAGAIAPIIDRLTRDGINTIILLTHNGYANDIALARSVDGIDIIIGGHTHTWLGADGSVIPPVEGPYPTRVDGPTGDPVVIVQAGAHGRALGRLDLTIDGHGIVRDYSGSAPILVDENWIPYSGTHPEIHLAVVAEDPAVRERLKPYRDGIETLKSRVVAHVSRDIHHVRLPGMRHPGTGEIMPHGSELAQLMAEIMYDAANDLGLKPDLAVQNAGGVRMDLPAGDVTVGDVYELLPFENTLVVLDLAGSDLIASLESLAERLKDPDKDGWYPYFFGSHRNPKK
ncbi:MAG TPA: bifunctional metallophosphatase/5'-nucleotidase [bacterium]|nr:bifunctional metallophosphatase/5'-nucleotidase [bacterium]